MPAVPQPVHEPLLGPHVGPLDVDGGEPVVVPRQAVAGAVALEELQLGDPVEQRRRTT